MSDLIAKIQGDIDDYRCLCEYFNEKPKYIKGFIENDDTIDCYGKHSDKLKKNSKKKKRSVNEIIKK